MKQKPNFRGRSPISISVGRVLSAIRKPVGWTSQNTIAASSVVISAASLYVAGTVACNNIHKFVAAEISILDAQLAQPVKEGREIKFVIAVNNSGNTSIVLTEAGGKLLTNESNPRISFVNGPRTEGMSMNTLEPGKIALATVYVQMPQKLISDASGDQFRAVLSNPRCDSNKKHFLVEVDALIFGADGLHYGGTAPPVCVYVEDNEVVAIQAFAGAASIKALRYQSYTLPGR